MPRILNYFRAKSPGVSGLKFLEFFLGIYFFNKIEIIES